MQPRHMLLSIRLRCAGLKIAAPPPRNRLKLLLWQLLLHATFIVFFGGFASAVLGSKSFF